MPWLLFRTHTWRGTFLEDSCELLQKQGAEGLHVLSQKSWERTLPTPPTFVLDAKAGKGEQRGADVKRQSEA